jgi:hypothetical protein
MPSYTAEQVTALREAIAGGELIVRSGDRSVQYRSLEEMLQVLRTMESDLAGSSTGLVLGRRYASFRRD